ncbi:DEAD/DEAH box helicase family protein [Megamonas funiformis]|uniref:DEAD/DEAH box helicase family protein n=1 Tax=Megamonas funiformis TaxID=437897 RepID=UPI00399B9FEF
MSIHLYKHNEDAYRAVETMLEDKQMAAVIHPTGTGKSMIAFKLVEQHPHKHFLWLSPSEYIYKTQLENIDTQFSNIEYMSYSRLMKHEDSIDTLHPDYIILDEFHRCGAAEWGKSVRKLLEAYPKAKRLGLSATNIRYLDNQRNMAEELFEGNIASEMTLGEAIVREILPEPKYVIAMYSYKKELEQLKKRIEGLSNPGLVSENEKLLEQLKRALEQADGLAEVFARQMTKPDGKYIVFCSSREHMDEMKEQAGDWFSKVDKKPHIYTAYYNDASTSKAFAEFKKDTGSHLKLLYCIDMLNEGIHVDDVDGVILLRPTVSPIIYLQQIGRALSAGSKNQPVIFDLVNNFDSLYCIDCLKNEMQEAFLLYPDTHSPREHFDDRFRIIDETKDSREIFMRLQENLGSAWDTYYEAAKQWYEENGNLKIPKSYVTGAEYSHWEHG